MKFGEILQLLMQEKDITLRQLSGGLHISQAMLSAFIRCAREPDIKTLKRIANYFRVSTDYLLDFHSAASQAENHMDADLLHVFRNMPPEQQQIYLEQGKAVARVCAGQ